MSEIFVLSPVSSIQPCLNIRNPIMNILQLQPDPERQILRLNPIEFGLTQRMVQVIDCLVVGIEHVPRSSNISCVHRNVLKDLTLSAEECCHPPLPHLGVLPIEVRRTRTPFLVLHLWILDWIKSIKTRTGSATN
jgi:hypothetical protein